MAKRVVLYFAFQRAKQPERIKEVLQMVYSSNGELAAQNTQLSVGWWGVSNTLHVCW